MKKRREKHFDYGDLFLDALNLTLNYKFLWVLGLLTALSGSEATNFTQFSKIIPSGNNSFSFLGTYLGNSNWSIESWNSLGDRFVFATATTTVLGIMFWMGGFIGQAGLIKAVAYLNRNQTTTLIGALKAGSHFLLSMTGITLLLYGPYFVVSLLNQKFLAIQFTFQSFPVIPFLLFFLILFPLGLLISVLYPLAQRGIILQELNILSSIADSWDLLRRQWRKIVVIVLILGSINMAYGAVALFFLSPLIKGAIFPTLFTWLETGSLNVEQVGMIVLFSVLGLFLSAPLNAYNSVAITLTYDTLRNSESIRHN